MQVWAQFVLILKSISMEEILYITLLYQCESSRRMKRGNGSTHLTEQLHGLVLTTKTCQYAFFREIIVDATRCWSIASVGLLTLYFEGSKLVRSVAEIRPSPQKFDVILEFLSNKNQSSCISVTQLTLMVKCDITRHNEIV